MSLVMQAHQNVRAHLVTGDTAIDATVGNGHDTLFLASAVGTDGTVYGFDVQQTALDNCYQRLQQHGLQDRVRLILAGHEMMANSLPDTVRLKRPKAIMFNLGYLPGGDKARTTQTETTLHALKHSAEIIAENGIISIIAYKGHPGGREEAEAVHTWGQTLTAEIFQIDRHVPARCNDNAPELITIRKVSHRLI